VYYVEDASTTMCSIKSGPFDVFAITFPKIEILMANVSQPLLGNILAWQKILLCLSVKYFCKAYLKCCYTWHKMYR